MEPAVGVEPTTDGLQNRCSTTELSWLKPFQVCALDRRKNSQSSDLSPSFVTHGNTACDTACRLVQRASPTARYLQNVLFLENVHNSTVGLIFCSSPVGMNTTDHSTQRTFKNVGECLWRHTQNGIYYALIKRKGKQYRRSLRTKDRKLAERRLASFRLQIDRISRKSGTKNLTFKDQASRFLSIRESSLKPKAHKRQQVAINQLNRFFGPLSVRSITLANCHDWEIKRGGKVSASTFNADLSVLRGILQHAVDEGILIDNPARGIRSRKLPKAKIVIPTHAEFQTMLNQIRMADARAVHAAHLAELLAYSGMRLNEGTQIRWGDVEFHRNSFWVTGGDKGTKNRESRKVPLFPSFRDLLERLSDGIEPSPGDRIVPIGSAKRAMETACKKAGLPNFTHHTLRHYFVSNAIEVGVDFKTIAAWVGHKDGGLLVAKTYGHLRDTHSFDMAARMTTMAAA